ncbi:MAG: hypothetical protein M5R36_00895 [Deltaproteobacteria bacterium]|nr:hypothetical protein [Deltaproteobacteria bacterium]
MTDGGEIDAVIETQVDGRWRPLAGKHGRTVYLAVDIVRLVDAHLFETYAPPPRPTTALVPFPYRWIPEPALVRAHRALVAFKRRLSPRTADGVWPFWDLEQFVACVVHAVGGSVSVRRRPPQFVFSHDVDGVEQMAFAEEIARIEADAGVRAGFFIPGEVIRARRGAVGRIAALGHEIGLHGLRHDNKHLAIPPAEYALQLRAYAKELSDLGVAGFRSPSLLTSPPLRKILAEFFSYDSSLTDTDIYGEAGGHHGCGVVRPYPGEGLTILPITLPFDDRLYTLGRMNPVDEWTAKARWVFERGGTAVLCTHACKPYYPDGYAKIFDGLLRALNETPGLRFVAPAEAAQSAT